MKKEIITVTIVAVSLLLSIFILVGLNHFCQPKETSAPNEPAQIGCGCVESTETSYEIIEPSKRRRVRVWIAPGTVGTLRPDQFRTGIIEGLREISAVTRCDFVLQSKESGARIKYRPATNEMMWKWFPEWRPGKSEQFPNGAIPLGAQNGNQIYLTTANRWGVDTVTLRACTVHETLHWAKVKYPENKPDRSHSPRKTDIMHAGLRVRKMSTNDIQKAQSRLGK